MSPGFSTICAVVTRACLAIHLHVGSNRHYLHLSVQLIFVNNCYLGWIIVLVMQSPYLQFSCSVELCGSLLWLPILLIQSPALPTPHRKWSVVGVGPGKFLHWNSFSMRVLVGGCLQGLFLLTELPWNLLAVPGIFAAATPTFDGTSSQAHWSAMSLTLINNIHHEWRSGSQDNLTVGRQPNPCRMEPLLWRKVSTTQPQAPIQMKG